MVEAIAAIMGSRSEVATSLWSMTDNLLKLKWNVFANVIKLATNKVISSF